MPRSSIRNLMIATAIAALLIADSRLAIVILVLAGSVAALRLRNRRRWAAPYLVTLACVYLPFSWVVLMNGPWDDYRWFWIKFWPILPGLPAGLFFHPNDLAESFVAGVAKLVLVALVTRIGAGGPRSLIVTNGIALILFSMVSFVAYQLFRS